MSSETEMVIFEPAAEIRAWLSAFDSKIVPSMVNDLLRRGLIYDQYSAILCKQSLTLPELNSILIDRFGINLEKNFGVDLSTIRKNAEQQNTDIFAKLSQRSIKAVLKAHQEAHLMGNNVVGTETLLLGLIAQETGKAGQALKAKGINLENARIAVEQIVGRGNGHVSIEIPFTDRALQAIRSSYGGVEVETEDLLFSILSDDNALANAVLRKLKVHPQRVRAIVRRMLKSTNHWLPI